MPDSTITWEERYEAIVNNERKKVEKDDRYDSHPSDPKPDGGKAAAKAKTGVATKKQKTEKKKK